MFAFSHRNLIEITILTAVLSTALFVHPSGESATETRFVELSRDDKERLDRQRAIVAAAAKRYGKGTLARTKADLPILQRIIDDRVFSKSQTYELQSLGVAFGDVLASELPLHWVMVTDEYGTDPTLRFKTTSIQLNALTMISKRIEAGEPVNLSELVRITREQLRRLEQSAR